MIHPVNAGSDPVRIYSIPLSRRECDAEVVTRNKLISFLDLPAGWHFGTGRAPSRKLVKLLIDVNARAFDQGFPKSDAFPGINGNVMLTLYYQDHLIDLIVEEGMQIASILYEKGDEEVLSQDDIGVALALNIIQQIGQICLLSGPYTKNITPSMNTESKVSPSRPPAAMEEFLYSIQSAQLSDRGVFANTSMPIILVSTSQAPLPSIGNLRKINYHPIAA